MTNLLTYIPRIIVKTVSIIHILPCSTGYGTRVTAPWPRPDPNGSYRISLDGRNWLKHMAPWSMCLCNSFHLPNKSETNTTEVEYTSCSLTFPLFPTPREQRAYDHGRQNSARIIFLLMIDWLSELTTVKVCLWAYIT